MRNKTLQEVHDRVHALERELHAALYGGRKEAFECRPCFHLGPCACGHPSYKQPCPVCGFYPEWGAPILWTRKHREECRAFGDRLGKEGWVAMVERQGNVAAWWLEGKRNTVAYSSGAFPAYRAAVDSLLDRVRAEDWPSASDVYDAAMGG